MNVVLFDVTEDYIVGDGRRRQRRRLKHLIIRGDNVVLVARAHDGPTPRDAAASAQAPARHRHFLKLRLVPGCPAEVMYVRVN